MPKRQTARAANQHPEKDLPIEIGAVPLTDSVPERLLLLARQLQQLFDARAEHQVHSHRRSSSRKRQL